jgi:hypothetical protein
MSAMQILITGLLNIAKLHTQHLFFCIGVCGVSDAAAADGVAGFSGLQAAIPLVRFTGMLNARSWRFEGPDHYARGIKLKAVECYCQH